MVATRRSLGAADNNNSTSSAAFVLPASTGDKKKDRLLRELYIDAAEGLGGEKKDESKQSLDQGKGVYTWRGAVYAITDDTPQEWIDAEAALRKKKEKEVVPRKRRIDDDGEEMPAKKVRRSMPEMTSRTHREEEGSRPRKKLSSLGRRRESRRGASEEPRPKTDIEIQKEMAKERGLEVDMLPEIKVKSKKKPKKATSKVVKSKKNPEPKHMSILERLSGRIEARQLAFDVAKMARLNTRIADVSEQIETAKNDDGKLDKLKEILRAPLSTTEEAHAPVQQQPTPEPEQTIEPADPPRALSSSTSTTPSLTTDLTLSPIVPRSSPELPDMHHTNRGGQKLRWSLSKPDILKDPDRAENAIQKNRLDGESKSARRRRVKREIEFVKTLPIAREDEDSLKHCAVSPLSGGTIG
ncbi:hypothetical protein AC578_900 [Pseudocercospora eumusae]|uniref:Uncharacterized protein n=1 Tax=Pseudocercospora eumusae TaxID=321146 RepID=A0A139HBU8_9PEZI|nr:hypothetical protein AC578_900 [Pseudocercospora eumusae]